ncbi:MAG: hypothetical protein B7W98_00200 [Parcubacteria group bacterium 20-58-5]|nr:MAG: hypothetical protein B7W98_00200 [Parcubacteria group bacterium 20-58-5]OYV62890.1 MAG: hypothetical protein B7X03_03875 [Parcubacteria group bacterium 21-58-10]HQT82791.1 hypothetical protein [Candidatus Paceibacterota bacterium]
MNFSDTISRFLKRLRAGALQDPVRDWLLLLTFSTLALAGIIVWNVWAFDIVANGGVIGPAAASAPPLFNSASLDAIHTVFVNRAAEQAKYVTGVYRYADPSQ